MYKPGYPQALAAFSLCSNNTPFALTRQRWVQAAPRVRKSLVGTARSTVDAILEAQGFDKFRRMPPPKKNQTGLVPKAARERAKKRRDLTATWCELAADLAPPRTLQEIPS
jgi:hypothetical protein